MYLGISASKFDELVRDGGCPVRSALTAERYGMCVRLDLAFDDFAG